MESKDLASTENELQVNDPAYEALRKFQTQTMTLAELNELIGRGPIEFTSRYKISCLEVEPVIRAEAYYKDDAYGGYSDWHQLDENRQLILENFEPTSLQFFGADKVMVYGGRPGGHTSYRFPLRGSMYFQQHDWVEETS